MALPANTRLQKTDDPTEWVVLFHGSPIGTIQKHSRPGMPVKWRLRWSAFGRDRTNSLSATFRLREYAVLRVLRTYLENVGSHSGRHNDYVAAVKRSLELQGESK